MHALANLQVVDVILAQQLQQPQNAGGQTVLFCLGRRGARARGPDTTCGCTRRCCNSCRRRALQIVSAVSGTRAPCACVGGRACATATVVAAVLGRLLELVPQRTEKRVRLPCVHALIERSLHRHIAPIQHGNAQPNSLSKHRPYAPTTTTTDMTPTHMHASAQRVPTMVHQEHRTIVWRGDQVQHEINHATAIKLVLGRARVRLQQQSGLAEIGILSPV
jgi:hypothetical protein